MPDAGRKKIIKSLRHSVVGRMEDSTVQKPHILTTFFFDWLELFSSSAQESLLETSIPYILGTKP